MPVRCRHDAATELHVLRPPGDDRQSRVRLVQGGAHAWLVAGGYDDVVRDPDGVEAKLIRPLGGADDICRRCRAAVVGERDAETDHARPSTQFSGSRAIPSRGAPEEASASTLAISWRCHSRRIAAAFAGIPALVPPTWTRDLNRQPRGVFTYTSSYQPAQ